MTPETLLSGLIIIFLSLGSTFFAIKIIQAFSNLSKRDTSTIGLSALLAALAPLILTGALDRPQKKEERNKTKDSE